MIASVRLLLSLVLGIHLRGVYSGSRWSLKHVGHGTLRYSRRARLASIMSSHTHPSVQSPPSALRSSLSSSSNSDKRPRFPSWRGRKGLQDADLRKALQGLGWGVALGVLGWVVKHPGLRRSTSFWARAFPCYLHYRVTELVMHGKGMSQDEQNVVWDKLHDQHADGMLAMVKRLKGYYVKICQVASARLDILPSQYVERFCTLQDNVPPKPGDEIIKIVEASYGKKIGEIFDEFDSERPLGSASIGQCHLARLKGSGKLVAVKVMYPEAEGVFRSDMHTLKQFAKLAQPAYVSMLDEIQKQFMKEFDYVREAQQQDDIRRGLLKAGFSSSVVVPAPYRDLCTREVLVMEFIPGYKLIHSVQEGRRDTGMMSYLQGRVGKWARKRYAKWLVDSVVQVHGHQILKMGLFNADPHPGNILLTPDGRLGLIDYGQIKQITDRQRRALAKIIVAIAEGRREEVIDLFTRMGFRSKYMKPDTVNTVATLYFDRDDATVTRGLNIQVFFERVQQEDPFVRMPEDFIMAARVGMFMRGLGTYLGYPISLATAWKPLALEVLHETSALDGTELPSLEEIEECERLLAQKGPRRLLGYVKGSRAKRRRGERWGDGAKGVGA